MKAGLLLILLFIVEFSAHAAIYKTMDANDNISYSDSPFSGSIEINVPNVNQVPSTMQPESTISADPQENVDETATNQMAAPDTVTLFAIESPKDKETIQNQPTFTVKFKVEPSLKIGNKIQLILDGRPVGKAESKTEIDMVNVDRGTHHLYAVLLDERNAVLKRSNEITIYVHRASLLNPPNVPQSVTTYPIQTLTMFMRMLRNVTA